VPPGPKPTPAPSQSSTAANPGTVVLDYFAAINNGNWNTAWALGGKNLYSSESAMEAAFSYISSVTATIVSVSGDSVVASVKKVTPAAAVPSVTRETFVVVDGVIISYVVDPPPPSPTPTP
jgi:hypothetical protein